MSGDGRVVYGMRCTWWDTIEKVALTPPDNGVQIPCCPQCGSPLFEVPSIYDWWNGAEKYQANGHEGYVDELRWTRGKCFRTVEEKHAAYLLETGAPS